MKKVSEYSEFDEKLLARIKRAGATFAALDAHMSSDAARLTKAGGDAFRVTDRRLQALRRRGLIEYSAKTGWSAAAQKGGQQ